MDSQSGTKLGITVDNALASSAGSAKVGEVWQHKIADFVDAILHGDVVHKAWLREAGEAFILGKPISEPRDGKGLLVNRVNNYITLRIRDCDGDAIKVVPTMAGNLQVGKFAGIVSVDEPEAILKMRERVLSLNAKISRRFESEAGKHGEEAR